jgi:ATP-dependent exoDNAse (exonuclease V) beta subunit
MRNVTYINAGAGSGKTYTLTKILAEKLSKKNAEVKPSQVILTTFTDLAAAEFKEKARQQILATGNLEVASQMDCASIGTVHSVALGFIKKFWYLLEYGADIQTISERDADFYMSQSLARIVSMPEHKEDLENFRKFRDYFDILDSSSHPDHLFWQQHLNAVVEKMEYYGVNEVEESIEKSIETLREIYTGRKIDFNALEELRNYLKKYLDYLATNDTATARTQEEEIRPLLNFKYATELSPLLGSNGMTNKPVGGEKKIESKCPGFASFCDTLQSTMTSSSILDILEPFVRSIFKLAKVWRDDFIAYKRDNHIISYNDMEQIFLRLLTDCEEVQDYVRNHIRLVMVDEFQDSNPIQLKIFNKLSEIIAPANGHSYWVGDPKQAIYGFRGADTDLVNSVADHFQFHDDSQIHSEEGPRKLGTGRLVESWRSRATLVNLVNEVFYTPFKDDGINELCIKLNPHFTNDDLASAPLVHWECDDTIKNQQDVADALACKVKELLASEMQVHRGKRDEPTSVIMPRDIAILCRKNAACRDVVKSLRKLGIPVSEAEDAIMQRIEVQLVVTLLQFMQDPKNKHVLADLMRLLWGNTTEEILKSRISYVLNHLDENGNFDAANDQWQEDLNAVKQLLCMRERLQHLSIPEMVRAIIYENNIPSLTARWGDEQVRRQNLSTLHHLAEDYDQMCLQMGLGTSISGFIFYLNSIEPEKEKDNKSNTVKVFTYHGSKGLEWPVVIMHGLGENVLSDADFTKKSFMRVREVVMDDKATEEDPFNKEYYLHFFPFTLRTFQNNPSTRLQDSINALAFYRQLKERTKSEERRLLYVGMTRAKDCLYTFGYRGKFDWLTNAGVQSPSPDNVWGCDDYTVPKIFISKPDESNEDGVNHDYTIIEKPDVHTQREKMYLSPSKITEFQGYSNHVAWKETGVGIETKGWNKENYATIGTCIHDIFAVYRQGMNDENRQKALSVIEGYGLTGTLIGHVDAILRSADWLYDQLQKHFPQTEADSIMNEYPFEMALPSGQHLRGEMDLLWYYTDSQGKHCVLIDYKTFPGVALNEHTPKHYAQLSAYAAALQSKGIDVTHALVYYPVHCAIHSLK